jgi:hypothetical protein
MDINDARESPINPIAANPTCLPKIANELFEALSESIDEAESTMTRPNATKKSVMPRS